MSHKFLAQEIYLCHINCLRMGSCLEWKEGLQSWGRGTPSGRRRFKDLLRFGKHKKKLNWSKIHLAHKLKGNLLIDSPSHNYRKGRASIQCPLSTDPPPPSDALPSAVKIEQLIWYLFRNKASLTARAYTAESSIWWGKKFYDLSIDRNATGLPSPDRLKH